MKISIIVPVYNVEVFLPICIESLLAQSYKEYEIILVNDASTDNSGEICNKYSNTYNHIKVIHHIQNKGVTEARKTGFLNSCGEYIYFVDADDQIKPEALSFSISMFDKNTDIVFTEYPKDHIYKKSEWITILLNMKYFSLVGKLYRREIFNDYIFSTPKYFSIGEDFLMQLKLQTNTSQNVKCYNRYFYIQTDNPNSAMHKYIHNFDYEKNMLLEVESIMDRVPDSIEKTYAFFNYRSLMIGGMIGLKYPISFNEPWIIKFKDDSKKIEQLSIQQRIVVLAIEYRWARTLLVLDKTFRKFIRAMLNKFK